MHSFIFATSLLTGGLDIYLELMQRFPNNVHILLEIAKVCLSSTCIFFILFPMLQIADSLMYKYTGIDRQVLLDLSWFIYSFKFAFRFLFIYSSIDAVVLISV